MLGIIRRLNSGEKIHIGGAVYFRLFPLKGHHPQYMMLTGETAITLGPLDLMEMIR